MGIALGVDKTGFTVGEIDAAHPSLFEGEQFTFAGASVGVGIDPHAQLGKHRVIGVDDPIAVGVKGLEGLKAIDGLHAVGQQGLGAEQFAARVDRAVGIAIPHQQSVARCHPARALGKTVGGVVEIDA